MNIKKQSNLLLSMLVLSMSTLPINTHASHDDGVGDVLLGVGAVAVGGLTACAFGAMASEAHNNGQTQKTNAMEGTYEAAYAQFEHVIDYIEKAHNVDIADICCKKVDNILHHEPCAEKALVQMVACIDDVHAYSRSIDNSINQLMRARKKVGKKLRKRAGDPCGCFKELADDIDELVTKLKFVQQYVRAHESYFDIDATYDHIASKYEQEMALYPRFKADPLSTMKDLRILVMSYGQLKHAPFPYLQYVDTVTHDKHVLQNAAAGIAQRYPHLYNAMQEVVTVLDTYIRELIIDPEYTQSLRDRERIQQEQMLRRQQEENRRLQLQLEQEKRRPTVVIEHEYVAPAPVYVRPAIPVEVEYVYEEVIEDPELEVSFEVNI